MQSLGKIVNPYNGATLTLLTASTSLATCLNMQSGINPVHWKVVEISKSGIV